jgi:hypothetical protein
MITMTTKTLADAQVMAHPKVQALVEAIGKRRGTPVTTEEVFSAIDEALAAITTGDSND